MNLADSERLAGVLESAGYSQSGSEDQADIILVNACVVRQTAEDRAAGYVSSIKGLKQKNPNLKIGLCGCFVSEPDRDVKKQFSHVDFFIPPHSPEKLAEFLRTQSTEHRARNTGRTAWITIMHGCDNFCSYCIVPYVRGREYSRPIEEILSEVDKIDFSQYKEIFLLGQNVNSYKYGLANLLRKIDIRITHYALRVPIKFMTSHPRDMSDDIINAVRDLPHVCEYFHLPLQHGADRILKSMNRGYTADDYRKLIDRIRSKIPNASITSDVIVGYPGETDEDFHLTLYNIEQNGFDACNTAAYSVRPATAASKLPDDIPQKVKQARLQEAMKVVENVARKQNEKIIGSTQEILVDSVGTGRTRTNKIVKFSSDKNNNLAGKFVKVKINSAKSWVLKGERS